VTVALDLWDVTGQERAAAVLRGAAASGETGHAWAFVGPSAVGQQQAARALAAALNCPQPPEPGQPCGACSTCDRRARGAHAAYMEFTPTGAFHRVGDVRERWLRAANRTLVEGSWKVLRIADADRMNEASANAFLKGLEEPPPRTVWVLDVADPDELPETILSRCRLLRFAAWSPEALDDLARELGIDDPGERALAVRASLGAPAVLRRLAEPGGLDDLRAHREIIRRLRDEGQGFALVAAHAITGKSRRKSDPPTEVERRTATLKEQGAAELAALEAQYGEDLPRGVAKDIEERHARREREARTQVVTAALDDLLTWLRDGLLVVTGGDPAGAIHVDDAEALRADAEAMEDGGILTAIDRVFQTREALERNVQTGLALEALFMELAVLARGR
jgi:DNA polymerase III subunit delta'